MTTSPAILTAPDSGFTVADDLFASWIGEDGDIVILGHHDDYRIRGCLKAFDEDVKDCPFHATWAVLVDPPTHDCVASDTTSCAGCDEIDSVPWWLQWDVAEGTPGAFPVTVVEA